MESFCWLICTDPDPSSISECDLGATLVKKRELPSFCGCNHPLLLLGSMLDCNARIVINMHGMFWHWGTNADEPIVQHGHMRLGTISVSKHHLFFVIIHLESLATTISIKH